MADAATAPEPLTDDEVLAVAVHGSDEQIRALTREELGRAQALLIKMRGPGTASPTTDPGPTAGAAPAPAPQPAPTPPVAVQTPVPEAPKTVPGSVPTSDATSAVFNQIAYRAARSMGATPENALMAGPRFQTAAAARSIDAPPIMSAVNEPLAPGPAMPPGPEDTGIAGVLNRVSALAEDAAAKGPNEYNPFAILGNAIVGSQKWLGIVKESETPPSVPHETSLASTDRMDAARAEQQRQTLEGGQPSRVLPGGSVGPMDAAVALELGGAIAKGTVESLAQTVFEPSTQAREDFPGFATNLSLVVPKFVAGLAKATDATKAVDEAVMADKTLAAGALKGLDDEARSVDEAADAARMFSDDPEIMARIQAVQDRMAALREKAAASVGEANDAALAEHAKATVIAEPKAPAPMVPVEPAANEITAAVQRNSDLKAKLGASALGGALLASGEADAGDTDKQTGGVLSVGSVLFGAALGYGVFRFFKTPEFRKVLAQAASLARDEKGGVVSPDFEAVARQLFLPLLPDRPVADLPWAKIGAGGGALAGTAIGLGLGQDDRSDAAKLGFGLFGLATGAILGAKVGEAVGGLSSTGMSIRKLYDLYFTEGRGLPPDVQAARQAFLGKMAGRIQEVMDVATASSKFDETTRAAMDSFLRGDSSLASLPKDAAKQAIRVRLLFDEMALDLVDVGIASGTLAKTLESNLGTYLPRLLIKFEADDGQLEKVQKFLAINKVGPDQLRDLDGLKRRMDIPDDILKAMGEIRDNPAYLLGKRGPPTVAAIETRRYLNWLASSEHVLPAGEHTGQTIEEAGRTFVKMPEGKRFGPLSGQYLEQSIAQDVHTIYEAPTALQKLTTVFKASKVAYNPATIFRNVIGNVVLSDVVAGLPPGSPHYVNAVKDLLSETALYREARRAGLFGGRFVDTEILQGMLRPMEILKDSLAARISYHADQAGKSLDWLSRGYQSSETLQRMALYRRATMDLGMAPDAAVAFAKRTAFDYQQVPRWVQVMRRSPFGAPFVSFSYKAIPRVLESAIALGDPWKMARFWKYPLAFGSAHEYAARELGGIDEDEKGFLPTLKRIALGGLGFVDGDKYEKLLPDYMGSNNVVLPYKDQWGRLQYIPVTWYLPWGDISEVGKGSVGTMLAKAGIYGFPKSMEPSNPWLQMGAAALTGKDPGTGRQIIPDGSTPGDASMAGLRWMMRLWGPSVLNPAGSSITKLQRTVSQDFTGDPGTLTPGQWALSELAGAKAVPLDPRLAYGAKYAQAKSRMDDAYGLFLNEAKKLGPLGITAQQREIANPKSAAGRALARYKQILSDFQDQYGKVTDLPPTPERLTRAMRGQ